ncbi:hypothetical protein LINPERHAP1_LOCUS18832 [Linum perenne]
MVLANDGWNLDLIRKYVEEELVDEITGMIPPCSDHGADEWIWSCETSGKFSILPAYEIVVNCLTPRQEVNWNLV